MFMDIEYLENLRNELITLRKDHANLEDKIIDKMEELQGYQEKCDHIFCSRKCKECGMSEDDYEDYMNLCYGAII